METIICSRIILIAIISLAWRAGIHTGFTKAQVVVTAMNELSAREGETVTLVCTYTPKSDSFSFGLLSWQMSDTVLASYSCPSSCTSYNSEPDKFRLDVDQTFSGNLTITDITISDDNPYTCFVNSLYGTGTSSTTLVVNVPPTNLQVSDTKAPDGYASGQILLVLSGEDHTMTCMTESGANPAATLTWTTDTVQYSQGTQTDQAVAPSKLSTSARQVTFNPTIEDHMTRVSCQATHPALDTDLESFVQLDVQVPPRDVTITYGVAVIADGGTLTLQEGSMVVIACKSLGTRPASTIVWFLDGTEVTQGVSSQAYAPNAADTRLEDSTSTIIIHPTRDHHGKVMRCQATVFGVSRSSALSLSVEGPPDPPVITGLTNDLRENQQTTISCDANNGHPAPSFQWFVGPRNLTQDAMLQMSADVNNRIDATSRLTYTPVRKDNGGALRCSVTHPTLSQPMSVMSDTLIVNYCPTSVEITACPEVEVGSSAVMVCRSGAANPSSNLVWIRDTETIDDAANLQTHFEESDDPIGRRTSLSYRRTFSQDDYMQSFHCCTSQSLTCVTTTCSVPCVPNVKYPPSTPIISRNIPDRYVNEGFTDVEITCRSNGNPTPSLVWIFEDNPGMLPDQTTLDDGSQVFRFGEVRRRNSGVYKCIANNGVGSPQESSDQLIVQFPATIVNKGENRTAANEGANATLSCTAEGFPEPIITWERADININESIQTWNRSSFTKNKQTTDYKTVLTSTLSIRNVRPKTDHGLYRCIASNSVGSREEFIITLTGTSKPEPPSSVAADVQHRKANKLLVTWQPGFDGGVEQTFVVTYCLNTTPEDCESVYGIRSSELRITELHPFSLYTISVSAENSNGRSAESSALIISTAPLPPSSYGIQVSKRKGVVAITSDAPQNIPVDLCFMITSKDDMCNPGGSCHKPDVKVQRPIDQEVTVVSVGRGLCSAAEQVQAAELAGSSGIQMPVIGAVIGSVIVVLVLFVIIILIIKRNNSRKGAKSSVGTGIEGQGVDKNGQAKSFLSGGYCAYNPVYDDVAKEDFRKSQHEGRMVSDDGLIYAEVSHMKPHPKNKPPIRTEEETLYATLDYQQMKKNKKEEEKDKEEEEEAPKDTDKEDKERAEKEALIYENVTPTGRPISPV